MAEGVDGIPDPAVNPVPEADTLQDLLRERDGLPDRESPLPPPPPLESSLTSTRW